MREPDLKVGASYEHTYGRWLRFFRDCAEDPSPVVGVPSSWAPFLYYLGCTVQQTVDHFEVDRFAPTRQMITVAASRGRLRELVEATSGFRPELADALYKSDVVWATAQRRHTMRYEFNVTCNGSFFRPEVLAFVEKLREYEPPAATMTIIVPCAADKPYPAPLHTAVAEVAPWAQLLIATGVLGLIPRGMWDEAPHYDSGIPNEVRVRDEVMRYFSRIQPAVTGRVIVYADFYAPCVLNALAEVGVIATWPVGAAVVDTLNWQVRRDHGHVEYIDLLAPAHLSALRDEVNRG